MNSIPSARGSVNAASQQYTIHLVCRMRSGRTNKNQENVDDVQKSDGFHGDKDYDDSDMSKTILATVAFV